ncbi:MAG: hypothetical protein L0Y66_26410 [Myxococcaceae bacterium]|nr:hypothetical protein [Myxococcaceae bacterium]MCI0672204.1 hypothetical protein [Myxococcaceae bacterium]
MSAHAVVRIAGHRLRLVPFPPYRLSHLATDEGTPAGSLHMVRVSEGEVRQFELRPGAPDAPAAELARVEDDVSTDWVRYRMGPTGAEVRLRAGLLPRFAADGSLMAGPDTPHWTLETSLFRCRWPEGLVLASTEEGAPAPFELLGPQGAVLFLQGPLGREQLPALEEMVSPGQQVLGTGTLGEAPYVDVAYTHEGRAWRQRHVVLALGGTHVLVLTAQALESHVTPLLAQAQALVESFRAGPFEGS